MHRYPDYTRARLAQLADRLRGLVYPETCPVDALQVSSAVDRIPRAQAQDLAYRPARLGEAFGPLWSTFWFKGQATVPAAWAGSRVDLLWCSHSEATLWLEGRTAQGLNHVPLGKAEGSSRPDAVLLRSARGGETVSFEVEMACNQMFGAPEPGRTPIKATSPFVLDRCELARFDPLAWEIYGDYWVLQQLEADGAKEKDLDRAWGGELLAELNRFANLFDPEDRASWAPAHAVLQSLLSRRNATTAHELSAVGHAHIDTAWLWPLAETRRKCERTFSTAVAYMEEYPEYRFACSQAQQYAAIKEQNPELYARVAAKVKAGQFIPVGGTWVEPDCNLPSGESLVRQFLYGQRFFQKEFGIPCREFWQPDVFGYNGQLPQLMRGAGIRYFLTQKLSWNRFNKPRHHTFLWQGIDGTEVLTHFPPTDTYSAEVAPAELRFGLRNYNDHDRSRHSLLLFGWGDGGGGPTRRMLENLRRVRDLEGLPRTEIRSPAEFFERLDRDLTDRPMVVGELYFEYHRGTYTTQATTKRENRKSEFLLHDVELLSALGEFLGPDLHLRPARGEAEGTQRGRKCKSGPYPAPELERLWKLVLTNQFHDILPGSSIAEVYRDAERDYATVRAAAEGLRTQAAKALVAGLGGTGTGWTPLNTLGAERHEVAAGPDGSLTWIDAPPCGPGAVGTAPDAVALIPTTGGWILENAHLRAELSRSGEVVSLVEKASRREALAEPGNVLELYDDVPTNFDAWDVDPFHLETGKPCPPAHAASVVESEPLRAAVAFERKLGKASTMRQVVRLAAGARRLEFVCDVDWQEKQRMLKVAFPVQVRAMEATYEMQFGAVQRPTHFNTTYDLARYEVPGHRWSDLSEHGFGVALLSESKYGYSTLGNTMRLSLLRAPLSPDPTADRGAHHFAYALMPHVGGWQQAGVVAEALRFNWPVTWTEGTVPPRSLLRVDDPNLVLDTVKRAEDSGALVVRLYETHGGRGTARLSLGVPVRRARFADLLEEPGAEARIEGGAVEIPYGPFQVVTLLLE